jgi:glycosyltransferase involved in cell wall biosynthesis
VADELPTRRLKQIGLNMRVLHVVPTYLPAVRYGGPIYSVHALCRALASRGHDVHVYTTNVDGAVVSKVPLTEPVVLDGVKVRYFTCGLGRRLYRSPEMGRAFADDLTRFDVLHLHSVFLWPTLAAARAARKVNMPYVLAPRGMLVGALIERKSRLLKSTWIRLFERANLAGAAAIHVTSELEKAELARLGMPTQRVAVVANGIELPDLQRISLRPSLVQGSYVLSLGRINWKKGLDRLIRAMADVPNADLLIAGNDEENYQSRLEILVRELGLSTRVHFLGSVYGEEKWDLIRSASVFVLPSYSENFGMAALEAMACGRPVVVTADVGLADIIGEAGAGIVVDGEAKELGLAIAALVSNPVLGGHLGEAGRKLASQSFSWDRIAEQMEQVYARCLGGRAKRA